MTSNDKQIGGSHYKQEYQHWDFCAEFSVPYLLGCATKYVYRWREKNGVQDLEKAKHYIQKAKETDCYFQPKVGEQLTQLYYSMFNQMTASLHSMDSGIMMNILNGHYGVATIEIDELIAEEGQSEASTNYVNQDG